MIIALKHEKHGVHIAYTDGEASECEKAGWVRDEAYTRILRGMAPDDIEAAPVQKKRIGRPPKNAEH